MSQKTKTGAELFQFLEQNFTKGFLIQYRISDIENEFTGNELCALSQLFGHYQSGWGTKDNLPAAIHISEREEAINYLDKCLGEA